MESQEPDAPNISTDRFQNRVAMVTGASSGIGKATAKAFAAAGARVVLLGRRQDTIEKAAVEIDDEYGGGRCLAVTADIRNAKEVEGVIENAVKHCGKLDVLFANAGINGVWAPIDELGPDEWSDTIATNLTGTFFTIKYAVKAMRASRGSVIINSSVNGTRVFSNSGATAYACAKAGLTALTKMLALELADHGIRVNAVCPGAIDTPIHGKTTERNLDKAREPVEFPAGRIPLTDGQAGTPDQVAQVVLFLASEAASHVTGSVVFVDGGESLLQG